MAYQVSLLQFEGPLDLLLQLIERSELEVTEISISRVTGQYLEYLSKLTDVEPEELGEFLHLAAKLLVIKSWSLVPGEADSLRPEEDLEELARHLEQYKHYQKATQFLANLINEGGRSWGRETKMLPPTENILKPELDILTLRAVFETLVSRLPESGSLEIEEMLSIEEALEQISLQLDSQKSLRLSDILTAVKRKQEAITFFLALLELSRRGLARLAQAGLHNDIMVIKV